MRLTSAPTVSLSINDFVARLLLELGREAQAEPALERAGAEHFHLRTVASVAAKSTAATTPVKNNESAHEVSLGHSPVGRSIADARRDYE